MDPFDRYAGWRLAFAAVLVGSLLFSTAGGTVTARPPPQAVCGVCSDEFVSAAAAEGVPVGVAESSLDVSVDRSGTGHWTARVRLTGAGVDALRENPALRRQIVERVHERGYVAVENPRSLTTAMDGRTLRVEYAVPGMAHASAGGVSVVDFFYWHGGEARWFYLAADSMTMRGPPGTVVSHAPADATVADRTVTWTGSDQQYDPLAVRTHVVFAPDRGVVSGVATAVGIGVDVAQLKARDVAAAGAPVAILALVVVLLRRAGTRLASLRASRLVGLVLGPLVALGLVVAAAETLVGAPGPVTDQFDDFLFYPLYVLATTGAGAVVVLGAPLAGGQLLLVDRLSGSSDRAAGPTDASERVGRPLVWPATGLLAGQWLLLPVAVAGAAGHDALYGLASLVLPVVYFVPLALTRGGNRFLRLAFAAGIGLGAVPAVFALAPHTGMGLVFGSLALLYVPWALLVAGVGTLAYAWGRRLVGTGGRKRRASGR